MMRRMNSPAAQPAADQQLNRMGASAAEEVRRTVRGALTELLANFLMRLPADLLEASPKATNPADRTLLQDLAKGLPAKATQWVETFAQKVDQHLIGGIEGARAEADLAGSGD